MARVTITSDFIVEAMQSQPVRDGLKARADRIAVAARAIDPEADIQRSDGTRPKGRPYSRVTSDDVPGEWGDSNTARRRTLGRAAEA